MNFARLKSPCQLKFYPRAKKFVMLAVIVILIFLFCVPVIFFDYQIPYDFTGYHYPIWSFIFNSFCDHIFPVFDPYTYGGIPFLSLSQSGLFYPLNGGLLYVASIFSKNFPLQCMNSINGLHMVIEAIGFYTLAMRHGASSLRALSLSLLVVFSGVQLGNQQHPGIIAEYAWLPWGIIAIDRIVELASSLATAGMALVIGLIISIGYLPLALLFILIFALYAVMRIVAESIVRHRILWETVVLLSFSSILGLGLASPLLLTLIEFMPSSNVLAFAGPVPLQPLATTVFPSILGNFSMENYFHTIDITKSYLFTGPAIWLALAATLMARLPRRRCLQILLLVAILFSFGPNFLVQWVQGLPFLGILLRPIWMLVVVFFLPFLFLADETERKHLRHIAVVLGWLSCGLILIFSDHEIYSQHMYYILEGLLWLTCFSILTLWHWKNKKIPLTILLLLCAVALYFQQNIVHQKIWSKPLHQDLKFGPDIVDGKGDLIAALRTCCEPYRIAVDQEFLGGPFNSAFRIWKLESINGMESAVDGEYLKYMQKNLAKWQGDRIFGDYRLDSQAFRVFNVRFLLTTTQRIVQNPDWVLKYDNYYRIYEYRHFTPRFQIFKGTNLLPQQVASVTIVKHDINSWSLACKVPGPNYQLVVSERWNRGWKAIGNDNKDLPLQPYAQGMNLVMDLPEGTSMVTLKFSSQTLQYSMIICMLSLLIIGFLVLSHYCSLSEARRQ